jgi:putative flippase GtrA
MDSKTAEQRLRRFLLAVTAAIYLGTIFELVLIGHYQETLQWTPFLISDIGFIILLVVWFKPSKKALVVLRWVMILTALGSLLGVYLHFTGNLAFTREINPSFTLAESIWPAMKGSYPLLAPGILFLAAVLGCAATWKHPLLRG